MDERDRICRGGCPPSTSRDPNARTSTISPPQEDLDSQSASISVTASHDSNEKADSSLEEALEALKLDETEQEGMFRALATVFQASELREASVNFSNPQDGADFWTTLQNADSAERVGARDAPSLLAVKAGLEHLQWFQPQLLLPALKILADGSRDVSWRIPLGDAGLLDYVLDLITTDATSEDLRIQALRLLGNSCADTDQNRQHVLRKDAMHHLIYQLENPRLATIAIPVVYNICCNYEPAQTSARQSGLYSSLIRLLDRGNLDRTPAFSYLCRILDLCLEKVDEGNPPNDAVEVLLKTATKPGVDVDDCATLTDLAVAHLKHEGFQRHMIPIRLFSVPLKFLVRSYIPHGDLPDSILPMVGSMATQKRSAEEEEELSRIRKTIIQSFSDISALPQFTEAYSSLDSPLVEILTKWLSANQSQLQLCACIVLGNIACSDAVCRSLVSRKRIHRDLLAILRTSSDSQVIHSALGFVRNLGLPAENKEVLGEAGTIEALTRFWKSESMPQISHLAAAVTRQLVGGCLGNVRRMLSSLSSDAESPAHRRTYLSLLLAVFERSDEVTVKTEIARVVTAILRCIHSAARLDQASKSRLLERLYSLHANIGNPLGAMVTQSRYPIIRSEGWFALALMARSPEGVSALHATVSNVNVFAALENAIRPTSGQTGNDGSLAPQTIHEHDPIAPGSSPGPSAQQQISKDRQNALVLVNEILQHGDGDIYDHIERSALEDLLHPNPRGNPP